MTSENMLWPTAKLLTIVQQNHIYVLCVYVKLDCKSFNKFLQYLPLKIFIFRKKPSENMLWSTTKSCGPRPTKIYRYIMYIFETVL